MSEPVLVKYQTYLGNEQRENASAEIVSQRATISDIKSSRTSINPEDSLEHSILKSVGKNNTLSAVHDSNPSNSTTSSNLITIPGNMFVHSPPFPLDKVPSSPTVRNSVIRRNQIFGTGPDRFNSYMEERLIRFRPSMSQNNVNDTLSGRHVYQIQDDIYNTETSERAVGFFERVFKLKKEISTIEVGEENNEPRTTQITSQDETGSQSRSSTAISIEEDYTEFSTQRIASAYIKKTVPSKVGQTNASNFNASVGGEDFQQNANQSADCVTINALPITRKDMLTLNPDLQHTSSSQSAPAEDNYYMAGILEMWNDICC